MREMVILGERACSGRGVALVEIQHPCDIVKQRMPRRPVLPGSSWTVQPKQKIHDNLLLRVNLFWNALVTS